MTHTTTDSGHRLRFVSSCAIQTYNGKGGMCRKSVPALPWRGHWAVTRVSKYTISVTHVLSGMKIGEVANLRVGRMICAVMNALPYDWSDYSKVVWEFRDSVWFAWIKAVTL